MNRSVLLLRLALVLGLATLIVTPVVAGEIVDRRAPASYLGGSVVSIPAYSNGSLDWSSDTELRFHYGDQSESWPYGSIVGLALEKPAAASLWKKAATLGVLALPMFANSTERELTVYYKNAEGLSSSVVFELTADEADALVPALESRTGKHSTLQAMSAAKLQARKDSVKPAANPHIMTNGAWWGDSFWRTNRNAGRWEKPEEPKAQAPQTVNVASSKDEE